MICRCPMFCTQEHMLMDFYPGTHELKSSSRQPPGLRNSRQQNRFFQNCWTLTNMPFLGLRIRPNQSANNFLSIGNPPRPQNPTKYIQIGPWVRVTRQIGFSARPHMLLTHLLTAYACRNSATRCSNLLNFRKRQQDVLSLPDVLYPDLVQTGLKHGIPMIETCILV